MGVIDILEQASGMRFGAPMVRRGWRWTKRSIVAALRERLAREGRALDDGAALMAREELFVRFLRPVGEGLYAVDAHAAREASREMTHGEEAAWRRKQIGRLRRIALRMEALGCRVDWDLARAASDARDLWIEKGYLPGSVAQAASADPGFLERFVSRDGTAMVRWSGAGSRRSCAEAEAPLIGVDGRALPFSDAASSWDDAR